MRSSDTPSPGKASGEIAALSRARRQIGADIQGLPLGFDAEAALALAEKLLPRIEDRPVRSDRLIIEYGGGKIIRLDLTKTLETAVSAIVGAALMFADPGVPAALIVCTIVRRALGARLVVTAPDDSGEAYVVCRLWRAYGRRVDYGVLVEECKQHDLDGVAALRDLVALGCVAFDGQAVVLTDAVLLPAPPIPSGGAS